MLQLTPEDDISDLQSDQELAIKRARALVDDLRLVCELEAKTLREKPADEERVFSEPPGTGPKCVQDTLTFKSRM